MNIYLVIALAALAVAVLFWVFEVIMFKLMLKGKIDSLTYLNPMPGFMAILFSWFPVMIVLGLMSGNHETGDERAFWGTPAFIVWSFILKKPMNVWRQNIYKSTKLTPKQKEELATRTAIANYLASGGLR